MNMISQLREKRNRLWEETKTFLADHRDKDGMVPSEFLETYDKMTADIKALGEEIKRLEDQAVTDREIDKPTIEKPPLAVKPYYVAAWQRISELIDGIKRQYDSGKGDAKLCEKWANEIQWQCSMMESLRDD